MLHALHLYVFVLKLDLLHWFNCNTIHFNENGNIDLYFWQIKIQPASSHYPLHTIYCIEISGKWRCNFYSTLYHDSIPEDFYEQAFDRICCCVLKFIQRWLKFLTHEDSFKIKPDVPLKDSLMAGKLSKMFKNFLEITRILWKTGNQKQLSLNLLALRSRPLPCSRYLFFMFFLAGFHQLIFFLMCFK